MTARILNGKALALLLQQELRENLKRHIAKGHSKPTLAVILVGDDPASHIYVMRKQNACKQVGIQTLLLELSATVTERQLIEKVVELNNNPEVHGILVQLPLPKHCNSQHVVECIDAAKDVDGLHPYNLGRLAQRCAKLSPCTSRGIMRLLDQAQVNLSGLHAVVVGASAMVGRPMALELLSANCTVTICHRFTTDLAQHTRQADILIVAVGKPGLIQEHMVKPGAIVIDVGINRLSEKQLVGDVEFNQVKEVASWITPVPGGVGPMTVAMLLHNTLLAAEQQAATSL